MFGDLAPEISDSAATRLLAEYFDALANPGVFIILSDLVSEQPAWSVSSPWDNGYSLALMVLDEADPDSRSASTQLEDLLDDLGILVRDVKLGEQGPRGVAFAGNDLRPTILVNIDNLKTKTEDDGLHWPTSFVAFCSIKAERDLGRHLRSNREQTHLQRCY